MDYIPKKFDERMDYYATVNTIFVNDGINIGLNTADVTGYTADQTALVGLVSTQNSLEAALKAQRVLVRAADEALEAKTRTFVQRANHDEGMSDALRAQLSLPIGNGSGSSPAGGGITAATPAPGMKVDFHVKRTAYIIAGTNPQNERLNKKPTGCKGIQLQFANGAQPITESAWQTVGNFTSSPIKHELNNSAPLTVTYRCRYFDSTLNGFSEWSDQETVTINP